MLVLIRGVCDGPSLQFQNSSYALVTFFNLYNILFSFSCDSGTDDFRKDLHRITMYQGRPKPLRTHLASI